MVVRIEPEAARCILDQGGHAWVRRSPRHGCCGGLVYVMMADTGCPENLTGYVSVDTDGVRVHIEAAIAQAAEAGIVIGSDGFGPWRKLWAADASV